RPPVALPGLERRVDVERRAARADYAMGLPLAVGYGASIRHRAAPVRRVGAGRLEACRSDHAESRRTVRLRRQLVRGEIALPAVAAGQPDARHEPPRPATRR